MQKHEGNKVNSERISNARKLTIKKEMEWTDIELAYALAALQRHQNTPINKILETR